MTLRYLAVGPVVAVVCFIIMMMGGYSVWVALGFSWLVGSVAVFILAIHAAYFCKPVEQAEKDKDVAPSAIDNV